MKISACMIAKNEEKNIKRCIESYKSIVNEIIVVDTGSTDKTIEIAEKLGAKIYSYEWNNDFAAAKNYALDISNGDWIIFLDADEYFERGKELNLSKVIRKFDNRKDIDGLIVKLYNIDNNETNIIDSMIVVRIFRNYKNIRFRGNIHEAIMKDGEDIQCMFIDENDIKIFHTGYSSNVVEAKIERNLEVLEANVNKGNIRPLDYIYLCDCYMSLHKYDLVIKYSREYLNLNNHVAGYNSKPYQLLINALNQIGCTANELKYEINNALKKFPYHPEFYRMLAAVYNTEKKYQLALETYLKVLKLQDEYTDLEINNVPSVMFDVYYNIGLLYEYKNDYLNALEYYYKSLKSNKYNEIAFNMLIKLLKNEKIQDIVGLLNTIYDNSEEDTRFIMKVLMKIKHGELLLHYYNIWSKTYKNEDVSMMYMLFSNHYYEKSFNMFYNVLLIEKSEEYIILAIVSAILSNKPDLIQKIINIADDIYINIINSYLGKEGVLLKQDNLLPYTKILQQIVLISNDEEVLNKYLNGMHEVESEQMIFEIVELLKDNGLYHYAINILSNILVHENKFEAKAYYEIGGCYYKLMDYKNAVICFEKAFKLGYSIELIICYFNWIRHINKDLIDENIELIIKEHSVNKEEL
ncbi:glycosyltransferase [Clostridium beijerinckii]|uniref:glycosyltransferase n=1 Tax=Clostridium beijerinckii TaxID=1520 RepID=UPI00232EA3E4|nr:glycosyltransferase [Clostridium beijerinckii]